LYELKNYGASIEKVNALMGICYSRLAQCSALYRYNTKDIYFQNPSDTVYGGSWGAPCTVHYDQTDYVNYGHVYLLYKSNINILQINAQSSTESGHYYDLL